MKTTRRHAVILILLVFLFATPGLSAYFLYFHPQWLSATTTNKGELLNPPILLTELNQTSKWRLILWSPQACEESCLAQLDKLARIRLALGRRLYNVDLCLMLSMKAPPLAKDVAAMLHEQGVVVTRVAAKNLTTLYNEPELFISNPDNYLVLAYPETAEPDDLFHDIKLLLAKGN